MINNEQCIDFLKNELENKGEISLTVNGDSMLPILKNGDMVKVQNCNLYKLGDIVAYFLVVDGKLKLIVHRVIFVRKTYVLTKGDNNEFIDTMKVGYNQILGKISFGEQVYNG